MIQKQLIISCCLLCFMASVQAQESVSSGTVITLQGTPLQMDEYTGTDFTTLILSRKIFFYDNTAMKEELYSPDGTVHTKIAYIYSEQGLLSEIRGTDAAGTPKWKYTYEYNEEGQLTTETSWNGAGQTEWVIYTDYTDNGLPAIQRTANPDGTVTLKKDFAAEYSRLIDLQTQAETSMRDEHKAIAQLNEQLIGEAEKGVNDPDYQSPIEDQLNRQIKAHQGKAKEYAAQYTKYQNDLEKLKAQYNENVQAAEKRHQENLKKLS